MRRGSCVWPHTTTSPSLHISIRTKMCWGCRCASSWRADGRALSLPNLEAQRPGTRGQDLSDLAATGDESCKASSGACVLSVSSVSVCRGRRYRYHSSAISDPFPIPSHHVAGAWSVLIRLEDSRAIALAAYCARRRALRSVDRIAHERLNDQFTTRGGYSCELGTCTCASLACYGALRWVGT